MVLSLMGELPHTDLRYSVGFPIYRESPLELRNSVGLTFPSKGRSPCSQDPNSRTIMTSRFDRLVFTILVAWFLQSLRRLCCFASKYIKTIASVVGARVIDRLSCWFSSFVKTTNKTAINNPGSHSTPTKRMVWGFSPK